MEEGQLHQHHQQQPQPQPATTSLVHPQNIGSISKNHAAAYLLYSPPKMCLDSKPRGTEREGF